MDTPSVHADMQASIPNSPEGRLATAQALYRDDDPAGAEALLRELSVREPMREDVARLLAEVQRSQGRLGAASETLLDVCHANGFEPGLGLRCAEFVRQCDRHAVAERICEGALARGAATPELLMLAGNVAREAGDFETARARYRQALQAGLDLDRHQVFGALANTRRYTDAADSEIVWFAKHFADARYSPRSRASAGFALAKAHDDLGDYEVAAKTLRAANAMVCAVQPWDGGAWSQFVDARLRERVATVASRPRPDFKPVFIVGVPRSGTTFTATLL
jgi:tetratricopeptide (TPR) repeat protein